MRVSGLGLFATPLNPYAASWAYPSSIMRDFVRSAAWRAYEHQLWFKGAGGSCNAMQSSMRCNAMQSSQIDDRINVAMGFWRDGLDAPYVLLPVPGKDLYVWHLSVCGEWYAKLRTTKKPTHGGNFLLCSASRLNGTCAGGVEDAYSCIDSDSRLRSARGCRQSV